MSGSPGAVMSRGGLGVVDQLQGLTLADFVATWSTTSPLFVAFDNENGHDASATPATSATTAFAAPFRTWDGYLASSWFKYLGAGRQLVHLFKPRSDGGVYLNSSGSAADLTWRAAASNTYRYLSFEGTTDGSNDATDRIRAGGVTAIAGPNADGSWTVAAGTTQSLLVTAAGAIAADAAVGYRIRMTSGALLNRTQAITKNTAGAGAQFSLDATMGAIPANGDTFVIETFGVRFANVQIDLGGASEFNTDSSAAAFLNQVSMVKGIGSEGSFVMTGPGRRALCGFCGSTSSTAQIRFDSFNELTLQGTMSAYDTGITIRCGFGFLTPATVSLRNISSAGISSSGFLGQLALTSVINTSCGLSGACAFAKSLVHSSPNAQITIGRFGLGNLTDTRFYGITANTAAFEFSGTASSFSIDVQGCTFENIAGQPCIRIKGNSLGGAAPRGGVALHLDSCSNGAAGGNTDVVLDVTGSLGGQFRCGTIGANTVTATAGDIRLAGPAIAAFADLAFTNVIDQNGNNVIGTGGRYVDQCVRVTNKNGSALAAGDSVRGNGTTRQVVKAQASTLANASNLVGVMVTSPATDAEGYMVPPGGVVMAQFDGAPALGIGYLSVGTAGQMTTTIPPAAATNQKLRQGIVLETLSGNKAKVSYRPEILPVLADGLA